MELFRNKATDLEFKLNLEGNSEPPKARLTIMLDSGSSISFKAKIDNSTAKVSVPPLQETLKNIPSSCDLLLEVMVDDGYFVPWQETANFKNSVAVSVSEASASNNTTKPALKVGPAKMEEAAPAPPNKPTRPSKPLTSKYKATAKEASNDVKQFFKDLSKQRPAGS